jgi:chromosome partitioning protein
MASPKGGAGKSTATILLGTELAAAGAQVHLVDADPNRSLRLWAEKGRAKGTEIERITLHDQENESSIIRTIRALDQDGGVVIVDLEGVASRLVSRAISQADLVITPMRATMLDAEIGGRAIALIREEEEQLGRQIPHAVLFTCTKAVRTRQHTLIEKAVRAAGVDVIAPALMERAPFSALFEYGGDLRTLPAGHGNVEAARENARGFMEAVFKRLTAGGEGKR